MKYTTKAVLVIMVVFLVINTLQVQATGSRKKCAKKFEACEYGGPNNKRGNCCPSTNPRKSVILRCYASTPTRSNCKEWDPTIQDIIEDLISEW